MSATSTTENHEDSLPVSLTTFVGRERQIADIVVLLAQPHVRLLTVTGPGGVGKTRLAIEAARAVSDRYRHGASFVSLVPVSASGDVLPAIARALDLADTGTLSIQALLAAALRERELLLVVDNFEHVLDAAPALIDLLLACPNLDILATSRAVLHVQGEYEYPVPSLALPESSRLPPLGDLERNESIALFVQRARAARPDFHLTMENAPIVAEICTRLDGLPLAIELAAARVKYLQPAGLLGRLINRLPLLTGGPRDAPARQQTLSDTISWSYELLTPEERRLFRLLSVFVGGCTLEAAEAVAGADIPDVFGSVTSLVDKSLLRHVSVPNAPERFAMLETIREFGLEQLSTFAEIDAARDRHVAWCLAFVEAADRESTEDTAYWIDIERPNIRAALTWLSTGADVQSGARILAAVYPYWFLRGNMSEIAAWHEPARRWSVGMHDTVGILCSGYTIVWTAIVAGDYDAAWKLTEEFQRLIRAISDTRVIARLLFLSTFGAIEMGRAPEAARYITESVQLLREHNDSQWLPLALDMEGFVAYQAGDLDRAECILRESLTLAREGYSRWSRASALTHLARVHRQRGDYDQALGCCREALELRWQYGDLANVASLLRITGEIALRAGDPAPAARFYGAAEALRDDLGLRTRSVARARYDETVDQIRAALGSDDFSTLWAVGRAMLVEQAVMAVHSYAPTPSVDQAAHESPSASTGVLSPREAEVLQLLADGRTTREIADTLYISPRTVTTHITHILDKLGVGSQKAAIAQAFRSGLLAGLSPTVD